MVASTWPLTRKRPSGLKATDQVCPPCCPFNVLRHRPLSTSHIRMVLSGDTSAKRRPSGLNVCACNSPPSLDKTRRHRPLLVSHILVVPLYSLLMSTSPSGLSATDSI